MSEFNLEISLKKPAKTYENDGSTKSENEKIPLEKKQYIKVTQSLTLKLTIRKQT